MACSFLFHICASLKKKKKKPCLPFSTFPFPSPLILFSHLGIEEQDGQRLESRSRNQGHLKVRWGSNPLPFLMKMNPIPCTVSQSMPSTVNTTAKKEAFSKTDCIHTLLALDTMSSQDAIH